MNIGEIARRAGVARSTVSYALSGKRAVSEETRRRIQQVIDEVNYRPNANARALKEGRTRTLGLVIPPAGARLTEVQLQFVAAVVEAASRHELDVLLSPSGGDHDNSFERLVTGRRVDGVVLMEIRLDDARVRRLRDSGLPFVTIGRTAQPDDTCWVDLDYQTLVNRCVHFLADLGHRNIALLNRSPELLAAGYGPGHRASAGFAEGVRQRGLDGVDLGCADDAAAGDAWTEQLLETRPDTTAIATINEAALPGVGRALARARLTVPDRFSIVGVVANHWAEDFRPPLTAADVPAIEMGTRAVDLLVEQMATPDAAPRHHLLSPLIALRESTGPAAR